MLDSKNTSKVIFAYSTIGIQLAILMVVFVYSGYRLDIYLDSGPWFVLLGAFLGFGGGLYNLIKGLKQIEKISESEDRIQNNKPRKKWL